MWNRIKDHKLEIVWGFSQMKFYHLPIVFSAKISPCSGGFMLTFFWIFGNSSGWACIRSICWIPEGCHENDWKLTLLSPGGGTTRLWSLLSPSRTGFEPSGSTPMRWCFCLLTFARIFFGLEPKLSSTTKSLQGCTVRLRSSHSWRKRLSCSNSCCTPSKVVYSICWDIKMEFRNQLFSTQFLPHFHCKICLKV